MADGSDLAVRPRLFGDPAHDCGFVGSLLRGVEPLLRAERCRVAAGVADDDDVARVIVELDGGGTGIDSPAVDRIFEDGRRLVRRGIEPLGKVEADRQPDAIFQLDEARDVRRGCVFERKIDPVNLRTLCKGCELVGSGVGALTGGC